MSMYGYGPSFRNNPAISGSILGNSTPPMTAAIDHDDELNVRPRSPPRQSSPPKHRHDGTSPLPLGMDWSLAPLIWEGRNSVWPHDLHKGWSYCVTIPSLTSAPSPGSSDTVFYVVKVGIQSPEGISTSRTVPRRFKEFLNLYSELRKEFPKKNLPPPPAKKLVKIKSMKVLRMCALEGWMAKLLSDIDVSRTAPVAMFLELEAAARQACCELDQNESTENENYDEINIENVINSNGENITNMEELQRKCTTLELRLAIEQDARSHEESMKATTIEQNKLLMKELNDAKEQVELLRKQMKLKSKTDVVEVQSVKTSGKVMVDTCESLSDTIDVLETSDREIGLLLARGENAEIGSEPANEDDELRKLLGDILLENAKLREQVNSVIRHALSKPRKDNAEE
ncbi:hypothetical protein L1887_10674 [Cichorium endivia]|nr:hypothetical protein L1887_10674 [Cichorium endivia]